MTETIAAVGDGQGSFTVEAVRLGDPQPGEVLIEFVPAVFATPTRTRFAGVVLSSSAMRARAWLCVLETVFPRVSLGIA